MTERYRRFKSNSREHLRGYNPTSEPLTIIQSIAQIIISFINSIFTYKLSFLAQGINSISIPFTCVLSYVCQVNKTAIFIFLISAVSMAELSKSVEFSTDCKSWSSSGTSNSKVEKGFIKAIDGRTFFDFKKQLWIHLDAGGAVFYKQNDYMNILMGSHLISHQMRNNSADTVANVITTMTEIGKEMTKKDSQQWRVRSKNGRGEITFFLAPSEKCTYAPNASFISCRTDGCIIGPRIPNAKDVSKLCIKQLKLMSPEKTKSVTEVCKVFGNEKIFSFIAEESKNAHDTCGYSDSKLPLYSETKSACSDALGLVNALK